MKIRNVSPRGDLDVPALAQTVAHGHAVEVPDDLAANLLEQADNWRPVTPKKEQS